MHTKAVADFLLTPLIAVALGFLDQLDAPELQDRPVPRALIPPLVAVLSKPVTPSHLLKGELDFRAAVDRCWPGQLIAGLLPLV